MATTHNEALQEWKDFLESAPAYVERKIEHLITDITPQATGYVCGVPATRVQLYCEIDDGTRWFDCSSGSLAAPGYKAAFLTYRCRDCGQWTKTFALIVQPTPPQTADAPVNVLKLGEFPPFGSHVAKRLQKMLSVGDLELYRKGLRTEREGNGIGAAAYFRRVVENQWKALVTKLREAAQALGTPTAQLKVFDEALAQTQFSTAVDMLKDAIPAKLLILDGRNPLTLLYRPLSMQIHDLTDEQCLQQAADIRLVLNELFDTIGRVLADDAELKAAANRLQGT